jgi:hypothetical protein
MLPIAPIKKSIGEMIIARKKNTKENCVSKVSSKLCRKTLINNNIGDAPVKSKNIFSFPGTLYFKVKKISVVPNKKKRIVRGIEYFPRGIRVIIKIAINI